MSTFEDKCSKTPYKINIFNRPLGSAWFRGVLLSKKHLLFEKSPSKTPRKITTLGKNFKPNDYF